MTKLLYKVQYQCKGFKRTMLVEAENELGARAEMFRLEPLGLFMSAQVINLPQCVNNGNVIKVDFKRKSRLFLCV